LAKDNPLFYVDRLANAKIYELAEAGGRALDDESVKRALRTSMLIAATRVAELGESAATVDYVATEGIKMPQPPLKEIDNIGAAAVLEELESTNAKLGDLPLTPPTLLTAMAKENQNFYIDDQPNRWLFDHTRRTTAHAGH